jgi:hypothetical protein
MRVDFRGHKYLEVSVNSFETDRVRSDRESVLLAARPLRENLVGGL